MDNQSQINAKVILALNCGALNHRWLLQEQLLTWDSVRKSRRWYDPNRLMKGCVHSQFTRMAHFSNQCCSAVVQPDWRNKTASWVYNIPQWLRAKITVCLTLETTFPLFRVLVCSAAFASAFRIPSAHWSIHPGSINIIQMSIGYIQTSAEHLYVDISKGRYRNSVI